MNVSAGSAGNDFHDLVERAWKIEIDRDELMTRFGGFHLSCVDEQGSVGCVGSCLGF